jgi:hypothetical protein
VVRDRYLLRSQRGVCNPNPVSFSLPRQAQKDSWDALARHAQPVVHMNGPRQLRLDGAT